MTVGYELDLSRRPDWRRVAALLCALLVAAAANAGPYVQVLGIAQDGGYPQAGCFKPHCLPGWQDPARRQLVVALALVDPAQRTNWLIEATPDLPQQLYRLHEATPNHRLGGVFLTHAHIGHYTGLMHFGREVIGAGGLPVYAMPRMAVFLRDNGPWGQLVKLGNIELRPLQQRQSVSLGSALTITPLLVPHRDEFSETVGYSIQGPRCSLLFIPDIDKWSRWDRDIRDLVKAHDYALLDATFFDGKELSDRDMSQIPHPSVAESLSLFATLPAAERNKIYFIHFNHSNPLLVTESPAQQQVRQAGMHLASEGLVLRLD